MQRASKRLIDLLDGISLWNFRHSVAKWILVSTLVILRDDGLIFPVLGGGVVGSPFSLNHYRILMVLLVVLFLCGYFSLY